MASILEPSKAVSVFGFLLFRIGDFSLSATAMDGSMFNVIRPDFWISFEICVVDDFWSKFFVQSFGNLS